MIRTADDRKEITMRIKNPFYDTPVTLTMPEINSAFEKVNQISNEVAEDTDNFVFRAIQKVGVNVDRDKLIQALQADRARYEEAYRRGFEDCMKRMHLGVKVLEDGPMVDSLGITKSTEELKNLIKQYPDYPIVVMAEDEANNGDYPWMVCNSIRFSVGEILDCEFLEYNDFIFTDRDRVREVLEDHFTEEDLTGLALQEAVENMIESLEPYWKNVIFIWAGN